MIILRQNNYSKKKDEDSDEIPKKKRLSDYESEKGIVGGAFIAGGDDALRGYLKGTALGATAGATGGAIKRTIGDRKKYRNKYTYSNFRHSRGHNNPESPFDGVSINDRKDYEKLVRRRNRVHKNLKSKEAKEAAFWGGTAGGPLGMTVSSVASGAIPAYLAVKSGEMAADKADLEGKTDKEIVKSAAWNGLKTGALAGGIKGIVKGASRGIPKISARPHTQSARTAVKALGSGYSSAISGAFGGMAGAATNTKHRLKKRERDYKRDKKKSMKQKESKKDDNT